ncbi:MAG: MnmC family methyltransferase [Limisphaerales bacterium]
MPSSAGYRLVQLTNGVFSVHSLVERETFHPVIGPVAEAEALYVRQLRLEDRLSSLGTEFVIWDVGLGAAANALTVLRRTRGIACPVRLISFDHTLEPLRFGLLHSDELGYIAEYREPVEALLCQGRTAFQDGARGVEWALHFGDFPRLLTGADSDSWPKPHAILFDAFSPATNPAMWTLKLFTDLYLRLDPGRPCALPTYSRSTMLRVSLLLAGFFVGAGHATGEKEETTIAANALSLISDPLDRRWLQRARRSTCAEPLREPVYRRERLSDSSWELLLAHPQFR